MLHARLEFRQTQSLIITPQLQQAIKLLQLSNLDLLSFVEQEIEQNPLIEWDERGPGGDSDKSAESAAAEPANDSAPFGDSEFDGATGAPPESASAATDFGDFADDAPLTPQASYESLSTRAPGNGGSSGESSLTRIEDFTAQVTTLRDHLRQQLHIQVTKPVLRLIGDHLIDLIDDAGYMRGTVEEIAERLGETPETVQEVLDAIQKLEPAGVGARSLAECLALQLREIDRLDPAMQALLDNLELLGSHEYAALRRLCGVDDEDLTEMIAEIRALNPRPGADYGFAAVETVIPDILIERNRSGEWTIRLNDDTLPRISVNQSFYASAKRQVRNEQDKVYLQNCIATANWLARSLDQRRRTMLKVAHEIVRQQEAFLEIGVRGLKPLALKDVAERIGMHESTVSRVTSNKYMQTPRGTFELKYFFTSAIARAGTGDPHSSESVKHRIKELIDNECSRRVLSDDKIVAILRDEGIDIARRTVAKYREALRIPSSVQRRRSKNAGYTQSFAGAGG
ncbi:MAG: RNA polymerase factor sigma-54 [Rhodomicrobiaceae bacterium]